jgi:hypothetical protein
MAIEKLSFPMNSMVMFQFVKRDILPEASETIKQWIYDRNICGWLGNCPTMAGVFWLGHKLSTSQICLSQQEDKLAHKIIKLPTAGDVI